MIKRNIKKFVVLLIFIELVSISGCSNLRKISLESVTIMPTNAPINSTAVTPNPTILPQLKTEQIDNNYFPNFKSIKDSSLANFSINPDIKTNPSVYTIQGQYDLNKDGKTDSIEVYLHTYDVDPDKVQPYIKVNGIKEEIGLMNNDYDGVKIVDVDKNDKFVEIAYYDAGPSADPSYTFYRFDGTKLYSIGRIGGYLGGASEFLFMDGMGKLLSNFNICRFKPSFYSAWYELDDNKFVQKPNDYSKYLGKTYRFEGGDAFFKPCQEMPKDFHEDFSTARKFEACDIKLINIKDSNYGDRTLNDYFVELPNGEKGILYFFISD